VVTEGRGAVARDVVGDRAVDVARGVVVDTLDDVRAGGAVVTEGCGAVARGAVGDRAVDVARDVVVGTLDDVRAGGRVATGGRGDAERDVTGAWSVEPGNASLPTATPAPNRSSATSASTVSALAVRRRSTRPIPRTSATPASRRCRS